MQPNVPPQSDVPLRRRGNTGVVLLVALIALGIGVALGRMLPSSGSATKADSTSGLDFSLFDEVYDLIQESYVTPPQDKTTLEFGATRGLVAGLNDPNSNFMDPEETQAFQDNLSGTFEGIGVELGMRDSVLTVVSPLEGSPGEAAGLRAGDAILAIDDVDTSTLTLDEAVTRIRGEAGTEVRLLIGREGEFDAKEFTITRRAIEVESVSFEVLDDEIGLLEISRFGEDTVDRVGQAADEFLRRNVRGIVLDLRGNPGGFLQAGVDVASFFIKDGVIVSEEYGDGSKDEYKASGNARLADIPLVVLVDEGSASAAEIVAGALQDYDRATLVGAKTFGKGSVQELSFLSKGTSIRLTVALFVLPKGRKIDHVGIEPEVPVALTEEDLNEDRDPQFDKALEQLDEAIGAR